MDIEPGYNSDVVFAGVKYHVQTEDWGDSNPFVVTRVYNSGAVILSLKTPYQQIKTLPQFMLTNDNDGRQAIRLGMRTQHEKVLDQLISGNLFSSSLR